VLAFGAVVPRDAVALGLAAIGGIERAEAVDQPFLDRA